MNFVATRKLFHAKSTSKKKLRQSKLDSFLQNGVQNHPKQSKNKYRNAMLQEFFMGATSNMEKSKSAIGCGGNTDEVNDGKTLTSIDTSGVCLESHVVMAITEGRSYARGEVGLAAIDVNSPELVLCQLSDDMWYSGTIIKIQMLSPAEVLLPNTFFNSKLSNSKILTILRSTFPTVDFKETPRKHFHDFEALERIAKISCTNVDDIKIALENKYYALAACNALLSYVEIGYYLYFAPKSLKVVYQSRYAAMTIDMETSKRLELVSTLAMTNEKKTCLFSYMDHCMTRIGKRSLRGRILEPYADIQMIHQCHEAIKELCEKQNYLFTLRMILKKFHQVDRLMKLALITPLDNNSRAAETMIGLTLSLKTCLLAIPTLQDILCSLESPVFIGIRAGLEDVRYKLILDHIEAILNTDQVPNGRSTHHQKINAVKPNVDQVLDVSRGFYSKVIDEITCLVKELSTKYDLSLQLIYNASKGYQLAATATKTVQAFADEFVVISRKSNRVLLTTQKLDDLNARLKRIVDEIMIISNRIISNMLNTIRQEIDVVYLLTGIITELDLVQSFSNLSRDTEFCCPTFDQEFKIVNAVHPFLEFGRLRTLPIPNNVMATPDHNFFIITGPNMGGKTVYIKMIAVLQVMAQIGCFVPAESAQFRICDKLFSRIGFEDSVDKGVSSFGMEVEQMSFILNNITPNSLVIIDELGRGTNPEEGTKWAWQMCEQLVILKGVPSKGNLYVEDSEQMTNTGSFMDPARQPLIKIGSPFIFMTTHYMDLTKISDKYFNAVNLYLTAEENTVDGKLQLTYTHHVQMGVTPIQEYGLALARTVRFPLTTIRKAEQILAKLREARISQISNNNSCLSSEKISSDNERKFYDVYASIATSYRKNNKEAAAAELAAMFSAFKPKCTQTLIDSIRVQPIEDTLNSSALFKQVARLNESIADKTVTSRTSDESQGTFITVESARTAVSDTSWMSLKGVQRNDTTDLSKLSHHSLMRRIANHNDDITDIIERSSINESYVTVDEVNATASVTEKDTSQQNNSPVIFEETLEENDDHFRLSGICPVVSTSQRSIRDRVFACGDGSAIDTQKKRSPVEESNLIKNQESFFEEPAIGDCSWNDLQCEETMEFKFDSPEPIPDDLFNDMFLVSQQSKPENSFWNKNEDKLGSLTKVEKQSTNDISCIDLVCSEEMEEDSFAKINKQMTPLQSPVPSASGTSQYKFRLGLLDLPNNEQHQGNQAASILDVTSKSSKSVQEDFIDKYGKIIEDKYNNRGTVPSQVSFSPIVNRASEGSAAEFLNKYEDMLMKKCIFKIPPMVYDQSVLNGCSVNTQPRPHVVPPPARILDRTGDSIDAPKTDYSEWLSKYCRSRVKSLGMPIRRKAAPNSKPVKYAKKDIESANRKWETFYTSSCSTTTTPDTSASSPRRVSFSSILNSDYNK